MAAKSRRFRLQPDERLLSAETVWWGTNPTGTLTRGGMLYVTDRRLALGRQSIPGTILTVIIGLPLLLISMSRAGLAGPVVIVGLYYGWYLLKSRIRWLPGQRIGLEAMLSDVIGFRVEEPRGMFSRGAVALTTRNGGLWRIAPSGKNARSADGIAKRLRPALGRDPEPASR